MSLFTCLALTFHVLGVAWKQDFVVIQCLALTFPRFGKAEAIESMHFYTVLGATEIISVAPGLLGARLAP